MRSIAVSYTHLDVYKRQVEKHFVIFLSLNIKLIAGFGDKNGFLKVQTVKPVSYTHLDVYKRQYIHFNCTCQEQMGSSTVNILLRSEITMTFGEKVKAESTKLGMSQDAVSYTHLNGKQALKAER